MPARPAAPLAPPPAHRHLGLTLLVLYALAGASWLGTSLGAGMVFALVIAAAMALVIGLVLMELAAGHPLDRGIAAVAVLFVVLLALGALADVAMR